MKSYCTVQLVTTQMVPTQMVQDQIESTDRALAEMKVPLTKETLLDSLLAAGIPIEHSCGGNGTCTTCLVRVESWSQPAPQRNELEQERTEERNFSPNERLSCQLEAQACVGASFRIAVFESGQVT